MSKRIAVIIPALNEAGNIGRLVAEVLETDPFDLGQWEQHQGERQRSTGPMEAPARGEQLRVIVVDNGSTDATAQEARAAGAEVVHEAPRLRLCLCRRGRGRGRG